MNLVKSLAHNLGRAYIDRIVRSEFESHAPKKVNERAIELAFTFRWLNWAQPKHVLDVGTGTSPLPALIANCGILVTAIDNIKDYWPDGMRNRHWMVEQEDIVSPKQMRQYDMVTCISTIEHILPCDTAVRNMLSMVAEGGHLLLTCPYNERIGHRNVYEIEGSYGAGNHYPTRQYCRADLVRWLAHTGCTVVEQEYWQAHSSDYWSVGEMVRPILPSRAEEPHQLTCIAIKRGPSLSEKRWLEDRGVRQ